MKLADIRFSDDDGAVIATIIGEIDMSNVGEIELALTEYLPNSAKGLILDLSSVDYLDSSGIQLLFKLHASLRTRSQALVLVLPPGSIVADTFRLAGISLQIETAGDVRQGQELLASTASVSTRSG